MAVQNSKELTIEAEGTHPGKRLFFNGYAIRKDKTPSFLTLEFAFVQGGEVLDQFFCVVAQDDINQQRESFLKFLQSLDGEDVSPVPLPDFSKPQTVEIADFIGMARHGMQGEIIFHAFSWKVLVDKSTRASTQDSKASATQAAFVALLRCHFSVLRQFIAELYDDTYQEKVRNQKRR